VKIWLKIALNAVRLPKFEPVNRISWSPRKIMVQDLRHDIPLTGSNFGNLTAFRAIFSHIFTAHAQERPFMNFRLKF